MHFGAELLKLDMCYHSFIEIFSEFLQAMISNTHASITSSTERGCSHTGHITPRRFQRLLRSESTLWAEEKTLKAENRWGRHCRRCKKEPPDDETSGYKRQIKDRSHVLRRELFRNESVLSDVKESG